MAIFMFKVSSISRAEGRSAVAAAAYRSAEKIENQWDGVVSDYTRKSGVVFKEVFLPDNAPEEYKDRSKLWNSVELAEPSSSSRLTKEILLALPRELDREQQIEVAKEFAYILTGLGMCCDVCIHDPILRDDLNRPIDSDGKPTKDPDRFQHNNPHAHILFTVRPIGKDGEWEAKTQIEYLCKRGDEQKGFTKDEFRTAEDEGWQKQYRYTDHSGKKVWLTTTEAEEIGLDKSDRVYRVPRSTKHGRPNPTTEYWDDVRRIKEWRKAWEEILNRKFEELGLDVRVDSRSYAEQGIDRMPSFHAGPYVSNLEKRARRLEREGKKAEHTELGERNRIISDYNNASDVYHKADEEATKRTAGMAAKSVHIQKSSLTDIINGEILRNGIEALEPERYKEADINRLLNMMDSLQALMEKTEKIISGLSVKLENLGFGDKREKEKIQGEIDWNKQKLETQKTFAETSLKNSIYHDEETLRRASEQNAQKMQELREKEQHLEETKNRIDAHTKKCREIMESVPDVYKDRYKKALDESMEQLEAETRTEAMELMGDDFSEAEFQSYLRKMYEDLNGEGHARQAEEAQSKGRNR